MKDITVIKGDVRKRRSKADNIISIQSIGTAIFILAYILIPLRRDSILILLALFEVLIIFYYTRAHRSVLERLDDIDRFKVLTLKRDKNYLGYEYNKDENLIANDYKNIDIKEFKLNTQDEEILKIILDSIKNKKKIGSIFSNDNLDGGVLISTHIITSGEIRVHEVLFMFEDVYESGRFDEYIEKKSSIMN